MSWRLSHLAWLLAAGPATQINYNATYECVLVLAMLCSTHNQIDECRRAAATNPEHSGYLLVWVVLVGVLGDLACRAARCSGWH